jgi:hypothetical protein
VISVGIIGSMKKALIIVVVAVITANLGVVRAISVPVMLNNDQIEYIRNNCADLHIPIVSSKEAMSFFDATKYEMIYDPSKSFMSQYEELLRKVPK